MHSLTSYFLYSKIRIRKHFNFRSLLFLIIIFNELYASHNIYSFHSLTSFIYAETNNYYSNFSIDLLPIAHNLN